MGNAESTTPADESQVQQRQQQQQQRVGGGTAAAADDEPWWNDIEHENLILQQAPINAATPTPMPMPKKVATDEAVPLKIAEEKETIRPVVEEKDTIRPVVEEKETIRPVVEEKETIRPVVEEKDTIPPVVEEKETIRPVVEEKEKIRPVVDITPIVMDSKEEESPKREQSLEEFREELRTKREARQNAVQDMRDEINSLRRDLAKQKAENRRLRRNQGEDEEQPEEQAQEESQYGLQKQSQEQPEEHSQEQSLEHTEIDPDDENPSSRSRHANIELANAQLALQQANAENLSLRGEVEVVQRQVGTLKEVISCCKQMLSVKEEQCAQLKMKLQQIENSFSEREMKIMSNNLRQEYERQLVNIRQLRQLYEERQRVAAAEYENLQRLISIKRDELIAEQEKTKNFEERNQTLLKEVETANEELSKLREECSELKYEKRTLNEQVGAVNMLFSQLIMGFNGKSKLDIDRLNQMLEENRQLLNQMTQAEGSCSDGATLPKLLFELVEEATGSGGSGEESDKSRSATPTPQDVAQAETAAQAENLDETATPADTATPAVTDTAAAVGVALDMDMPDCVQPLRKQPSGKRRSAGAVAAASLKCHEPEIMGKVASAQEIIGNLPKVWKVLMELLSHHKIERVQFAEELPTGSGSGQSITAANAATAVAATGESAGPRKVEAAATALVGGKPAELSVSKTYIKLKDLILEKKSLVKETNRLKTLNSHLDYRLNEQEKRLSAVSLELTKTWHLVGKMQRQHRQLHTQEQILRYQLQQKRRLLSELKDELEYCRRKWAAARAKNEETQEQCDDWRREFARRKLEDAHHSAESGYSDSGPQSDEERDAGRAGVAAGGGAGPELDATSSSSGTCRRKHLRDQFEHTRKIKRMQSTSPGRQAATALATGSAEDEGEEIVLRWNSAPPTCGWRGETMDSTLEDEEDLDLAEGSRGAISKMPHSSRSRQRNSQAEDAAGLTSGTASRIQKLEEQCKSLIQQVLETSDNRERLEVQLCRFQDEVSPAQHAVPLDEFINNKRLERMTRASSAPATGSLTPREEEYTRKRSERLTRLEEESRQLMTRIRRTTDRGQYLKKSLDRIRRAPSREASFESNTEEELPPAASTTEQPTTSAAAASPLTAEEEAYTSRRAARLVRLEQESQQLLAQLSRNSERSVDLANKLDTLHERQQPQQEQPTAASISQSVEQRLEDIERVSANRAERLRVMEAQGNELIARLSNTSERGTAMINRMAEREASRRQEAELLEQIQPTEEEATSSVQNIASTRIADECEGSAACCVTVTTTATQQAQSMGAIPKKPPRSTPQAHLCAASRQDNAAKKRASGKESTAEEAQPQAETSVAPETLEDMVQRLRSLPFPAEKLNQSEEGAEEAVEKEEATVEKENAEETEELKEKQQADAN